MEPRVNYALVGLFIVVLLTGLVFGGLWLAAGLDNRDYDRYAIYITDSVSGLGPDSPVTYRGVDIGQVRSLTVVRDDPNQIRAVVEIERSAPVREGTSATLKVRGLTGSASVELSGAEAGSEPLPSNEDDPYPVIPYRESLLLRLETAITEGMAGIESLGERINDLLSPENTDAIGRVLTNSAVLSERLAAASARLDGTLDRADALLMSGELAADEMTQTMEETRETLAAVDAASLAVTEAGNQLTAMGESGEGGMRRLEGSTLPQAEALLGELRRLSESAARLTESLHREPGQLFRQREPVQPGPGER